MNPHNRPKWRRFSVQRAKYEKRQREGFSAYRARRNRDEDVSFRPKKTKQPRSVRRHVLVAPKHLSLFDNYGDTNGFLDEFRKLLTGGKKVFVDFTVTEFLSVETILVFLTILKEVGGRRTSSRVSAAIGTSPLRHTAAARMLVESGFYEHVRSDLDPATPDANHGTIRPREGTRVSNALADRLTTKAARVVFGDERSLPAVYRALIEVMGNTKQHAGTPAEEKRWWAMVHTNPKTHRAEFAFYDTGVGIIGSFRRRWRAALALVGLSPTEEMIMRDLMHGAFKSRTNLPYRGKGLPALAKAVSRRQIENLRILSNSVEADVDGDQYERLPSQFVGTLVYWEVCRANDNYSNQR